MENFPHVDGKMSVMKPVLMDGFGGEDFLSLRERDEVVTRKGELRLRGEFSCSGNFVRWAEERNAPPHLTHT
jgi:hypothetical protein